MSDASEPVGPREGEGSTRGGVARRTLYEVIQRYDQGLSESRSVAKKLGLLAINEDVCKRSPACAQML